MVSRKLIAVLFVAFSQLTLLAQNERSFNLGVQIRPRAEFRNGQGRLLSPTEDPAFFVSNRARLNLGFTSKRVDIGLGAQNVGVWGQQPQLEMVGQFMLNEAWAKIKMNESLSVTLGRQAFSYDDERMLGALDWHVSGRFHDGIRLKYEGSRLKVHLAGAYSANAESQARTYYLTTGQPYRHLTFLWAEYPLMDQLKISILTMNAGFQGGDETDPATWRIYNMQTLAGNLVYNGDKLKARGFYYYQLGQDKAGKDVSAFMAGINGSYALSDRWGVLAGADFLSGNDMNGPATEQHAFAPLYGTNHAFYGYMDYFYVGNHFGGVGLSDLYGGLTVRAFEKLSIRGVVHGFSSMGRLVNTVNEEQDKYLGTEVDISLKYLVFDGVALIGGYSQMFATRSMELIKGGDSGRVANWAWLMVNVNLNIFSSWN